MKSIFALVCIFSSLGVFASEIGKIVIAKGSVSVIDQAGEVHEGKQLYELSIGDKIQTGSSSYVKLLMKDDSVFQVGPNSEFALENFDFKNKNERTAVYNLAKGQLRSWFVHKSPEKTLTIKTPTASMGIRGTEILTDVYKDDGGQFKTDIALIRGKLEVAAAAIGGKIMLNPGQLLDGLGQNIKGRAPASARREHLKNLSRKVFDAVRKNTIDSDGAIFLHDARIKFGDREARNKKFGSLIENGRGPASIDQSAKLKSISEDSSELRQKLSKKMNRNRREIIRKRVMASTMTEKEEFEAKRKGQTNTGARTTSGGTTNDSPPFNPSIIDGNTTPLPPIPFNINN